ncbi:MAG TPA: hypothetical protein VGA42_06230 [Gemmatimonadales bacterium]
MHPCHPLLEHAIDHAGLFPPAALSMEDAAREYAADSASDDAWALGRWVVPAERLNEVLRVVERMDDGPGRWPLSVIGSGSLARDREGMAAVGQRGDVGLRVEAYETRADDLEHARETLATVPSSPVRFLEIPMSADPALLLEAIRARGPGTAAKFRTGGVTPDAFPEPDHLLRALATAIRLGVPFKCTAGLHHPVRGRYRLTYAEDSALARMYGYMNVMVAAAALRGGWSDADARAILLEESPTAFTLDREGVGWRGRRLHRDLVAAFRRDGMLGFGSCSFREPMDELAEIPVA